MFLIAVTGSLYAGPPRPPFIPQGSLYSRPNIYGGRNYYSSRDFWRANPNSFGGYNYFDGRGHLRVRTMPGVGGYERYYYYGR